MQGRESEMRSGRVLLVMVAVLAMAGAAGAQIYAVNADGISNDILRVDLGDGTVTGVCSNGIRSAANALVDNLHYSENISSPSQMVVVDLSDCSRTVFTRNYAPTGGPNNKLAAKADGTVYEIDRAGVLWQLTFNAIDHTVDRASVKVFGQPFGGGGDFAWGPDGLLYIASNETNVGNFIWDESTDTLTHFDSPDGEYNYQGICWYQGKLYGATAANNGSSGPGRIFELDPSDMSIRSGELAYYEGRLNDLASWPLQKIVDIDVKPQSYPNCFNVNGNGVIPVAILGSADFDVNSVDTSTVLFNGSAVQVRGKKQMTMCHVEDVSGDFTYPQGAPDGYPDLVCQFVDDPAQWVTGQSEATLTGVLFDGTIFEGTDSVCITQEVPEE